MFQGNNKCRIRIANILGTELASAISGIRLTFPPNKISSAIMISTCPSESQLLNSTEDEFSPKDPECKSRALSMHAITVVIEGFEFNLVTLRVLYHIRK